MKSNTAVYDDDDELLQSFSVSANDSKEEYAHELTKASGERQIPGEAENQQPYQNHVYSGNEPDLLIKNLNNGGLLMQPPSDDFLEVDGDD